MAHKSCINHPSWCLTVIQHLIEIPSFSGSELITFFFPGVVMYILFLGAVFRKQSV